MPAERHRVAAFCPLCVSRCRCEAVVEDGRLVAGDRGARSRREQRRPTPGHGLRVLPA